MLRVLLLYLSRSSWARRLVTGWSLSGRVASRFIAGEELKDALKVVKNLNEKGYYATLDHLGEHTRSVEGALEATRAIILAMDEIFRQNLQTGISVKLTQIGLELDEILCAENLARILGQAQVYGIFIRIDMEDSPYIDQTLAIFRWLVNHADTRTVGVVIQSCLYRTVEDTLALLEESVRIRLVKGAYKEPPELAFPKKRDVDTNFDALTDVLLDCARKHGCPEISLDGRIPPIPAIATQDEARIAYARAAVVRKEVPKRAIEFQMLHGIRRDLQLALLEEGFPVRIYVPYGSEWYPYFMRRLAERPANLWFFISNLLRR